MSIARRRRRLLALRRADVRFCKALGLGIMDRRTPISQALMRRSFALRWSQQYIPALTTLRRMV